MKDRSNDRSHHERTLLPRSYISLSISFGVTKKHFISKEKIQLPKELGGLGVVNIQQRIIAQRIKFISRLLSFEGEGNWKALADHFLAQYKIFNIQTNVLKCNIINKLSNFKSINEDLQRNGHYSRN